MEAPVAQPVMAAQPAVAVAVPVVAVAQQPPSYAAAAPARGGGGGARPSAWIYPVKGLSHFVQHPALWPYALCPLIIGVIATIIALILIFGEAFVPQQEWLEGWWGSAFLAWIAAFLLCLVEVAIAAIILLQIALGCILETGTPLLLPHPPPPLPISNHPVVSRQSSSRRWRIWGRGAATTPPAP